MSVLAGLAAVPVQAVDPDCSQDFDIPDTEPSTSRKLDEGTTETGRINVTAAGGDETVRVELNTNDAVLDFEIFEIINGVCQSSTHVNTMACEEEVTLDTEPALVVPPVSQDCELDAPGSGMRTFYFVFEAVETPGSSLDYKAWSL